MDKINDSGKISKSKARNFYFFTCRYVFYCPEQHIERLHKCWHPKIRLHFYHSCACFQIDCILILFLWERTSSWHQNLHFPSALRASTGSRVQLFRSQPINLSRVTRDFHWEHKFVINLSGRFSTVVYIFHIKFKLLHHWLFDYNTPVMDLLHVKRLLNQSSTKIQPPQWRGV